jgi:hypothetical protein
MPSPQDNFLDLYRAGLESMLAMTRATLDESERLRNRRLEDRCVNFAISTRGRTPGLDHLGIQVEADAELKELEARLAAAELPSLAQTGAACCYAKSDKHWTIDPQGVAWEAFHTLAQIPVFGADTRSASAAAHAEGCCTPARETIAVVGAKRGCCS